MTTTAKAPNPIRLTDDTGSTACNIINNCGKDSKGNAIDIVAGMPVFTSETELTTPVYTYNKDFEILQVAKGGTVIKCDDTDAVTLNHTALDSKNEPYYVRGYNLLVCRPPWMNPIANLGLNRELKTKTFADQTITADNATASEQAAKFYQTLQAYPDSELAQNYMKALSAANSAESADDFFKNTVGYKLVTLDDIVSLEAHYGYFPFIWTKYGDSASYYLYSSDGQTTLFQGTFSINRATGVAVDITKKNGGYTCTFTPAKKPDDTSTTEVDTTRAKNLTYSDGLFADDVTTDTPAIAFKGAFMLKRTFTKVPDDKDIMVVVCGTINGTKTAGFDAAQITKQDDQTLDWLKKLFDPSSAEGIFNSIMSILGALMMIHFVATSLLGIRRWIKKKLANGETPTEAEIAAQKAQTDAEFKAKLDSIYKKVSGDPNAKTPDTSGDALDMAADLKGTISTEVSKAQMNDSLTTLDDNLGDLEKFDSDENLGFKDDINAADNDLSGYYDTLNNTDAANLKATIEGLRQQVKDLAGTVKTLTDNMQKAVSEDMQAEISENQIEVEVVVEDVDNESDTSKEEGNDITDEDPDSISIEVEF